MTETLQLRRGTTAKSAAFTGAVGELTIDTDKKIAIVHDGATQGGFGLLRDDLSNLRPVKASIVPDQDNVYSLGSPTKKWADIYVGNNTIHIGDSTSFSGTSLVIDAGDNPTNLGQMPTLMASKLVAKPFQYNPGSGTVTVRPSIEFQDTTGTSYPISFNTATKEFSLDAEGNHGQGSLVAKKASLSGDLLGSGTTASLRWDGNVTLGYDSANAITHKGTSTFVGPVTIQGAATIGDGNDTVTINAGAANALNVTSSTLSVNGTGVTVAGALVVDGNLTINGTSSTIHSTNVAIGDNILILNAGIPAGQDPSLDAGIQVARGTEASVRWVWDEANDFWTPKGGNLGNIGTLTAGTINVTNLNATGLNATSAAKLTTPRSITLAGAVAGSVSFDGSSDVTIETTGGAPTNVAGTMMVLVKEQVVTDPAAAITFTGLNGDEDVEYEIRGHIVSGAGATYTVRFNGDGTIANYKNEFLYGQGTAAYAGTDSVLGGIRVAATAAGGQTSTFTVSVAAKSGSARNVLVTTATNVTATGIYNTLLNAGTWTNTVANITSLTVTAELGNGSTAASGFGAGTRVALYARKRVGGAASTVSASYVGARMRKTAAGSFPNTTWTAIGWDVADYDSNGFWSASTPTRITIPAGVNKVRISGGIGLGVAPVQLQLTKNGTAGVALMTSANAYGSLSSGVIPVVAGDYFILNAYQSSGTTATISNQANTYFDIEVVDPVPVAISGFGNNTTADYAFVTNSAASTANLPAVGGNIPFDTVSGNLPLANNGIVLKAGKTYELTASLYVTFSSNAAWVDYQFHDGTNWLGTLGEALPVTYGSNYAPSAGAKAVVTPMVDTTVYLRVKSSQNATTFTTGASNVVVTQIGGPANGLNYGPAGYAQLTNNSGTTVTLPAVGSNVPFNTLSGNLTLSGNGVQLKAGRVYLLQAALYLNGATAGGYVNYQFHDGTNPIGTVGQALNTSYAGAASGNSTATALYKPSSDVTVTLRVNNVGNATDAFNAPYSYMNVVELAAAVDTYSTTETLTDKIWFDGKPIYRKVFNVGALPTTAGGIKTVAHGLGSFSMVTQVSGTTTNTIGGNNVPLPHSSGGATNNIAVAWDTTNLYVSTQSTAWVNYSGVVTLEYVK